MPETQNVPSPQNLKDYIQQVKYLTLPKLEGLPLNKYLDLWIINFGKSKVSILYLQSLFIYLNPMTKILLIDDHQVVLESLKLLFRAIENVEVVGTLNDSREVQPFLENNAIDLVISDFHIPYLSGVDLTYQIRKNHPAIKVLLLTMAEDVPHIREAIRAGVNGYMLKKSNKDELIKAIGQVMSGKRYFSQEVIEELSAYTGEDLTNSQVNIQHLTERETEILRLIAMELSSNEIAEKLFISVSTVESHRRNLFQKLNVKSAIGLTKYALKFGLVE